MVAEATTPWVQVREGIRAYVDCPSGVDLMSIATTSIFSGAVPVLGASDFDWFKLIPFAIAVIIWIVGAIAKSLEGATKKPSQQNWTGETPYDPGVAPGTVYLPPPPIPQQYAPPPAIPAQWSLPPAAVPGQYVPPYAPPAAFGQGPPVVPPLPANRQKRSAKAKKKKSKPRASLVAEMPAAALPSAYAEPVEAADAVAAPPRRARSAGPRLDAAAIRRWMTPATLRQQYALTELFDPPPSARGEQRS